MREGDEHLFFKGTHFPSQGILEPHARKGCVCSVRAVRWSVLHIHVCRAGTLCGIVRGLGGSTCPLHRNVRRGFCQVPEVAPFRDHQNSLTGHVCPRLFEKTKKLLHFDGHRFCTLAGRQ